MGTTILRILPALMAVSVALGTARAENPDPDRREIIGKHIIRLARIAVEVQDKKNKGEPPPEYHASKEELAITSIPLNEGREDIKKLLAATKDREKTLKAKRLELIVETEEIKIRLLTAQKVSPIDAYQLYRVIGATTEAAKHNAQNPEQKELMKTTQEAANIMLDLIRKTVPLDLKKPETIETDLGCPKTGDVKPGEDKPRTGDKKPGEGAPKPVARPN